MGSRIEPRRILPALTAIGVFLSQASFAAASPTVIEVELHVPKGFDTKGLPELVAVHPGRELSARTVRKSLERLFSTGRFAEAVANFQPVDGGARVIFELTPKQKVAKISVSGSKLLKEAEVRADSGLMPEGEYYPEKVDAAVEVISKDLRRRGYFQARVQGEVSEAESGMEVEFRIEEGAPTTVAKIVVSGSPGLPLTQILSVLKPRLGATLDQNALEEGLEKLRALYRSEHFYLAKVGEPVIFPSELLKAGISLPLSAGPRFEIHFHGNHRVPDGLLEDLINYDGTEALDRGVRGRLARRIENFYRFWGFHDVRVTHREVDSPHRERAVLVFDIDEGLLLKVWDIQFSGNQRLSSEELKDVLVDTIKASAPSWDLRRTSFSDPFGAQGADGNANFASEPLDPASVLVEEAWISAAQAMTKLYRERGFLKAEVQFAGAVLDEKRRMAIAQFLIQEGPETRLGAVRFRGVEVPAVQQANRLVVGEIYSESAVENSRALLLRALGKEGYLFAKVDVESRLSPDGKVADVTLAVEAGPQVRVGQVILRGSVKSRPELILDRMILRPGDVLDPEKLFESQRRLVLLGTFRQVTVRLLSPESVEPVKDVVVEVRERPKLEGDISGGYFLAEGPRVMGTINTTNIGGVGLNASLRGKLNYVGASTQVLNGVDVQGLNGIGGRGTASLVAPRGFGPLPNSVAMRMDLIGEREFRPYYQFNRVAGVLGGDFSAVRWLDLSLQYEIEYTNIPILGINPRVAEISATSQERLRFPLGSASLQSLRPGITLDFRNDPANPTSGFLLAVTSELTHSLSATLTTDPDVPPSNQTIFTLKVQGNAATYIPLARRVTLALSVRAGRIFLLDKDSPTIAPKRFYLGGGASLRGFREDGVLPNDERPQFTAQRSACSALANPAGCTQAAQLLLDGKQVPSQGGELFTLGKAEVRFPLPSVNSLDGAVFFEAGNLWLRQRLYQPFELRYTTGAGIRYATPIGPLALDLGFNLFPDQALNEPVLNLHFNIGLF